MPVFADVLRVVQVVLFGVMGVRAFLYWHQPRRGRAEAWLALAFGSIGLVLLASVAQPVSFSDPLTLGDPLLWAVKLEVSVVLLFPYLLLQFAGVLTSLSRRIRIVGAILSVIVVCFIVALPGLPATTERRPWWIVALLVTVFLQWGYVGPATALALWRAGRNQPTVARRRMQLLASGTGALLLTLAPGVLASSNRPHSGAHVAGQLAGVVAAGLFYLGLVPPSALRVHWRRRVLDGLIDGELGLMQATTREQVADVALPLVAAVLGGRKAALVDAVGRPIGMIGFDECDLAGLLVLALEAQCGVGPVAVTDMSVVVALSSGCVIAEIGSCSPFFGVDEAAALSRIGLFMDLALGRIDALAGDQRGREALMHQALHDALTGLPNRLLLADRLQQAVARRERSGSGIAVLFLDIDRFKWINDSMGHHAGDALLVEVAKRLKTLIRGSDTVSRFGGDEFVLVCEDVGDEESVVRLAQRCAEVVSVPVTIEGVQVTPTLSIGIAHCLSEARLCETDDLLRDADAAMYQAKENGRGRVEVFGEATRVRISDRLETEQGLRQAIDAQDIIVYYQPEVDLATSEVVSVEALARWRDPVRGIRIPAEFIPAAEETGLIIPLGQRILEIACLDASSFQTDGTSVSVAVNLSAKQLLAPQLPKTIEDVLSFAGLGAERLVIEITESVLLTDLSAASKALGDLRDLGLRIAVDDFGTGYSSLLYLKGLPIDYVKIDRAFTSGLGRSDQDKAIVSAIIDMAHAFGLTTTAEGVETPEQLAVLRGLGCERAQGYHWSPPLPPEEVGRWMRARSWAPPSSSSASLFDRGAARGQRVLVIDDDAVLREVVRITLGDDKSIDFQEAHDGRTGVAVAGRFQPNVILLDLALPGMGGLDALPLLKAVAPDARIFVLSAVDSAELVRRALAQGAEGYLQKHADMARLPALIG